MGTSRQWQSGKGQSARCPAAELCTLSTSTEGAARVRGAAKAAAWGVTHVLLARGSVGGGSASGSGGWYGECAPAVCSSGSSLMTLTRRDSMVMQRRRPCYY